MIEVKVIPHNEQRYATIGDWQFDDQNNLTVRVSQLDNGRMNYLVAIHEIVEAMLCRSKEISEKLVDKWDKEHPNHVDPGSIPGCPYYREHMVATMIERVMAAELEIDWQSYEMTVMLCK